MAVRKAAVPKAAVKSEAALTKNQIITELTRSPHGKLEEYVEIGRQAAKSDPEFFARLIAWDERNGQIRDAKVALPIVSLTTEGFPNELIENSLAHLAKLNPKMLLQAARFAKDLSTAAGNKGEQSKAIMNMNALKRLVPQYLTMLEKNQHRFDAVALQHRKTLKELYALFRAKDKDFWKTEQGKRVQAILFRSDRSDPKNPVKLPYPAGSVFEALAALPNMSPKEAAGTIMNRKIPFLIAKGALGAKAKDPDLLMALIDAMSPQELVNNAKALERLGVQSNPMLKSAYAEALRKSVENPNPKKKTSTLKTSKAVEAITDETLKKQLSAVQEKQIDAAKGIDGNWLVIGDKSGSMSSAIEGARQVAATLARFVRGDVHLFFVDTTPRYINATGKTIEELSKETRLISAGGGTALGAGLVAAMDRNLDIDGIAIVTDGGDNTAPLFASTYERFVTVGGRDVPVYVYRVQGDSDTLTAQMKRNGRDVQIFDLKSNMDYYSIPNLVQTMRASRYSLLDDIMDTPLLTLKDVFGEDNDSAAA